MARRHYSAGAIALACALYGMLGATLSDTRRRTSPWRSAEAGWPTLRRWLQAVERRVLFRVVRPWPREALLRARAERVAATLVAFAPLPHLVSIEARAFEGAAFAGRD
ncbi:hypothetical protein [Pendulispora albinea]|uniref:Uncharacterized protein n=1 Tax=Pendulispora albinea TaxID=2741071 RepID=A0ABZ2MAL1_9BACT